MLTRVRQKTVNGKIRKELKENILEFEGRKLQRNRSQLW